MWPFLCPESEWDFRLEQVRSINTSGHKYGLVYPGIGWLVFRETADLADDLVFYESHVAGVWGSGPGPRSQRRRRLSLGCLDFMPSGR